jgi:YD repeat-containing protein
LNHTDHTYTHAYTNDPAGNPVARTGQGRQTTYTYNALNQRTGGQHPTETDVAGRL